MSEEPDLHNNTLQEEHNEEHRQTVEVLKETDQAIEHAQVILAEARKKLKKATEKYQERLDGPTDISIN